ncbi:eukaryotic translation initiation factor 2C, 2, partial [Actinomortierella ambigua]
MSTSIKEESKGLARFTENAIRPDQGGTIGRPITIEANFFAIRRLPTNAIHHYDVKLGEDVPPRRGRQIWRQIEASPEMGGIRAVFDGRFSAYSATKLPFHKIEIVLDGGKGGGKGGKGGKEKHGKGKFAGPMVAKLTYVNIIDLTDLHKFLRREGPLTSNCTLAMQALNVAVTHEAMSRFVNRGGSVFFQDQATDIGGGVEMWKGLFQALKPGRGGSMFANIDVAASVFIKGGNAANVISSILPREFRGRVDHRDQVKLDRMLRSATFTVTHRGEKFKKRFKVSKVSALGARDLLFDQNGRKVSVQEYFEQTYHCNLRYPHLPCLGVRSRDGDTAYFPSELCEIEPGQKYTKKLDESQTSSMIKEASQRPSDRMGFIQRGMRQLDFGNNQHLRDFGFEINTELERIPARVLPAPDIVYSGERVVHPDNGGWRLNPSNKAFQGATLERWGVLCFETERGFSRTQMQKFIVELTETLCENGLRVNNRQPNTLYVNPQARVSTAIDALWTDIGRKTMGDPQIIIVILPRRCETYADVKSHCEAGETMGKMTQCVLVDRLRRANKQYYGMLGTKINAKLGGTNWVLKPDAIPFISQMPTMIIGADVTHPAPGDATQPSVVAVVASVNKEATRYVGRVKAQAGRTEVIDGFKYLIYNLIKTFKEQVGHHPRRILVYRDGVSDGEFAHVLREEMIAIKQACLHVDENYRPPVTFVIVKKRHHARFQPLNRHDADKTGNCPAGTVVDQVITHPTEFDFYLQSHSGLLGTSRPALYHVLWDENGFSSNDIQQLTYNMCYLYARCPKAVSIVPPVYYAHLLAFRARHYL